MLATEFDDEGPNMSDTLYVLAASYDADIRKAEAPSPSAGR